MVTRGPFDPGGQPETRIGQPLELGFFAWNIKGGMTASTVLNDIEFNLNDGGTTTYHPKDAAGWLQ